MPLTYRRLSWGAIRVVGVSRAGSVLQQPGYIRQARAVAGYVFVAAGS